MKIIKLNRRWNQFKEHRHTMCLRFDSYTNQTMDIERILRDSTGSSGWNKEGDWHGYFGKGPSPRPYFITFRDETLVSIALLKIDNSATIA